MAKTLKHKLIKPIENYAGVSDGDVAARATAVQTAMYGKSGGVHCGFAACALSWQFVKNSNCAAAAALE